MIANKRFALLLPVVAVISTGNTACDASSQRERPMGVTSAVAAGGYLYALNEVFGRVVRLDPDGGTDTVRVGKHPEALAATADGSWVLTLSRADHTLWAVQAGDDLRAHAVEIRPNHNTIAVSPSAASRFAITFVDLARLGELDIDGSASLNEVTVIDLMGTTPAAVSVVVGFNPKQVVFTPDGTRAVVLSESFASIIDLAAPTAVRIPLGANTTSDPVTPETVMVTPDNALALVARRASSDVFVITLEPPSVNIVDFKILPTRFAASSDGTTVLAISEYSPTVAMFDIASGTVGLASAEGAITDVVIPIEAADHRALFWGDGLSDEQAYSLDLDSGEMTTISLVNPPTRIAIGPGGSSVVLQTPYPTFDGDETSALFDVNDSLSILDPDESLITPHFLESEPIDVAFATDAEGKRLAIVTLRDAARLAVIDLDSLLIVSRPHLTDAPRSLVPLGPPSAAAPVAVIHDQDWGLVSFLHPDGTIRVASGFLLQDSL